MKRFAAIVLAVGAVAIFASESNAQCYRGGVGYGYRGVNFYTGPAYRTGVTYGRSVYGYNRYSPSYSVYRNNHYVVPVYRNYHPYRYYNNFHPGRRGGVYYGNRGGFGINIRF